MMRERGASGAARLPRGRWGGRFALVSCLAAGIGVLVPAAAYAAACVLWVWRRPDVVGRIPLAARNAALALLALALMLILNQLCRALTERLDFEPANSHPAHRHQLLLLLDEFAVLGRLDLPAADSSFATAWRLWNAGEAAGETPFGAWRLYDLEASLRRDQRRFDAALACLERALASAPAAARGRILLKKQYTFDQAGNVESALAVLEEAAPLLEATPDAGLRWSFELNAASMLCHAACITWDHAMLRFATGRATDAEELTSPLAAAFPQSGPIWSLVMAETAPPRRRATRCLVPPLLPAAAAPAAPHPSRAQPPPRFNPTAAPRPRASPRRPPAAPPRRAGRSDRRRPGGSLRHPPHQP